MKLITILFMVAVLFQGIVLIVINEIFWFLAVLLCCFGGWYGAMLDTKLNNRKENKNAKSKK